MEKLLLTFAVIFILGLVRRNFQKNIELEYRYKFFALRDKLRELAIEGKIKKQNWEFNYLDSSLCKTVNQLSNINLIDAFYIHLKHKNDPKKEKFKQHLNLILEKDKEFSKIYSQYGVLLVQYICRRHLVITMSIGVGLFSIITSIEYFNRIAFRFKQLIKEMRETPENSTAHQYC
jgi:hypothetical protein